MDLLTEILKHPFTWGLLLGLLIAGFIWKSGFSARRNLARELKRVEAELKNLQSHLNTQLKITATGHESLQSELASLKQQNENLRVNHAALQQKPGRAEQRLLQIQEIAIRTMREQAPGFAAAWENAIRQGEAEVDAAESGLKKLVRRVIPGYGNPASPPARIATDDNLHS
jgi:DNA anti-recombination protein RmuC